MSDETRNMLTGDDLSQSEGKSSVPSISTREMLAEHLESTRDSLAELWDRLEIEAQSLTGEDDAHTKLDELPLEIVWEKGEPFAVVLGTGGPHIEIRGGTRHDGSGYALHGYWSGEHVTLHGSGTRYTSPTRKVGKFWFVVYPNRTWSCVSERSLTLVQSRDEQLELSA